MTTDVTISASDVSAAADFLESFMSDQVPLGDFSKGTALRDIALQAIAGVVAFLRADASQIRQMQSLVTVEAATTGDTQALTDAVTAILSNFLVSPNSGTFARGFAIGHSTQQVDVFIPTTVRFTYSAGLIFVVDSDDTLFIPAAELVPIIDSDSSVLDYEYRIPLVAIATGTAYNITPALFAAFDRFSPYTTSVEVTDAFTGGLGVETVDALIARAPTAVSVRNLVNSRSIVATLNDNFDGISNVLVLGMGEPEMQRDVVPTLAPHLVFHVGGCVDIYLRLALVETSFTAAVGDLFERPDEISAMFRDSAANFSTVLPGDIIHVTGGLPSVPADFLVVNVIDTHTLTISEQSPFPVATDEAVPPTTVTYTIGRIAPLYVDIISTGGLPLTTGITSRRITTSGRITLPGGPVMDIIDVAVINPSIAESAFKSTLDGFVHFTNQVNATPQNAATPATGLQFQTIVHNYLYAQSALQWLEVVVGTDANQGRFDGYQLRVRYRTLQNFDAIDSFVRGDRERICAAFQLPRGHTPVVVSISINYRLNGAATTLLDNTAIAQTVIDFINNFDSSTADIDVSAVIKTVMDAYPTIANIVPQFPGNPILTIQYVMRAPTGDVLSFQTADLVFIDPSKQVSGPALALLNYGVSGRTIRYVANSTTVSAQQVGV